ncbi:MAG TPA: diguanylate cyclase [Verrucomicrobiae bacterium]|nr:diguanylate cyclase [Verrucomicrobiae bacterium]
MRVPLKPSARLSQVALALVMMASVSLTVAGFIALARGDRGTYGMTLEWRQEGSLEPVLTVATVEPGSAASQAGLTPGDRVARFGAFSDRILLTLQSNLPLHSYVAVGEPVAFVVERGNSLEPVRLVARPTVSENQPLWLYELRLTIYLLSALVVGALVASRPSAVTWGFALFVIFGMQALAEPLEFVGLVGSPAAFLTALLSLYMINVFGFMGLIVFAVSFPRNAPPAWYLAVERVAFGLAIVAAFAICEANLGKLWGWPVPDAGYLEFARSFWISVIAISLLVVTFAHSRGEDRIRLAWAIAGPSIGTLCIVADHWFYAQGFETAATAMGLLSSIAPLSMLYAILRHRVIDVRFPLLETFAATVASVDASVPRGDRRELVRRAALLLSADLPFHETLAKLAALLAAFVDASSVLIAVGNGEHARLEYNFENGTGGRPDDPSVPPESMTARVLSSGTSLLVRSMAEWPGTIVVSVGGKPTQLPESAIFVTATFGGETVGAISVQSQSVGAYDEEDLALLESCALYLGARIHDEAAKAAAPRKPADANIDAATGLVRAAVFDEALEHEWRWCGSSGSPLSIVIVDLDLFDAFIEAYGTAAADTCLRQVAGVVRASAAAPQMVAARYGRDCFAVLLPGCDVGEAVRIAEAIRAGVASLNVEHHGSSLGELSISAGVASCVPQRGGQSAELLRQARERFDAAKAAGRNRVSAAGHDSGSLPAHRRSIVRTNLVLPHAAIRGRETEIAQLRQSLAEQPITVIAAPAGYGKTRLVLETGSRSTELYPDGVWYVDLARAGDRSIAEAVAEALYAGIRGDIDEARLCDLFRQKKALLLLDNAEHLGAAADRFAGELVAHAPGVRAIVATRDPRPGAFRLEPLSHDDAVALYLDRAGEAAASSGQRELAGDLVDRLGRVPLAIELAAGFPQLASKVLSGDDPATAVGVQQLFDWTYEALSSDEATVLRRVAVFEGDWSVEAACAVCSDGTLAAERVILALGALETRGLVKRDEGEATARFALAKAAREYALAALRAQEGIGAAADRHLRYYADYAHALSQRKAELSFAEWSRLQRAEFANYRTALRRALRGSNDTERMAQILRSLGGMLDAAFGGEIVADLKNALHGGAIAIGEQAAVWLALSELLRPRSPTDSLRAARHAFELYRDAADEAGMAYAVWQYAGAQVRARGEIDAELEPALRAGLRAARSAGDRHLAVGLLRNLAYLYGEAGRHQDAREALREAAELADRSDGTMLSMLVGSTALEEFRAGSYDEAVRLWRRAAALAEEASPSYAGLCFVNAGLGELLRGDTAASRIALERGLAQLHTVGHRYGILVGLSHAARLAMANGDPERAARIAGFTETYLERGPVRSTTEQLQHDALMASLRTALGHSALERERGRGLWMSLEDVIAEAYAA